MIVSDFDEIVKNQTDGYVKSSMYKAWGLDGSEGIHVVCRASGQTPQRSRWRLFTTPSDFGIVTAKALVLVLVLLAVPAGGQPSGVVSSNRPDRVSYGFMDAPLTEKRETFENPEAGLTWQDPVTGIEFVWIPGGCFQMGQTEDDREYLIAKIGQIRYTQLFTVELPRHQVCLDGFWMAVTEVTNAQYRLFMPDHRSGWFRGVDLDRDNQPVVNVSWEEANAFIDWLNAESGLDCRLPTEAQWEYAARAGTTSIRFWGNDESVACRYANVADTTVDEHWTGWTVHPCRDGHAGTAAVGRFLPNDFGLYDMQGNVWEWCADIYDPAAYSKHAVMNPESFSGGSLRVARGGSWTSRPGSSRIALRGRYGPMRRRLTLGFRIISPGVR